MALLLLIYLSSALANYVEVEISILPKDPTHGETGAEPDVASAGACAAAAAWTALTESDPFVSVPSCEVLDAGSGPNPTTTTTFSFTGTTTTTGVPGEVSDGGGGDDGGALSTTMLIALVVAVLVLVVCVVCCIFAFGRWRRHRHAASRASMYGASERRSSGRGAHSAIGGGSKAGSRRESTHHHRASSRRQSSTHAEKLPLAALSSATEADTMLWKPAAEAAPPTTTTSKKRASMPVGEAKKASGGGTHKRQSMPVVNNTLFLSLLIVSAAVVGVARSEAPPLPGAAVEDLLAAQYDNCRLLDYEKDVRLHWTVAGGVARFALTSIGAYWQALGVSTDGTMHSSSAGSDIALSYIEQSTSVGVVLDMWTTKRELPTLDAATQSSTIERVAALGGYLLSEWQRPLGAETTDEDRAIDAEAAQWFIWAINDDTQVTSSTVFARHTRRGSVQLKLADASECPAGALADNGARAASLKLRFDPGTLGDWQQAEYAFIAYMATALNVEPARIVVGEKVEVETDWCDTYTAGDCASFELRIDNYTVPLGVDTIYTCFAFDVNQSYVGDWDLVRWEIIIDNAQLLHHIVLYSGNLPSNWNGTTEADCEMPFSVTPVGAWAPGQPFFEWPDNTGFPVPAHILFQTHYDIPDLSGGLDSSGMRFYVVRPRREVTTIFSLPGVPPTPAAIWVPPLETLHVSASCQMAWNVTLYAVFFHQHVIGKQLWLDVYRGGWNGTRESVDTALNYDFNAQEIKLLPQPVFIDVGDIFSCHNVWYNYKNGSVYGGGGTNDEMGYCGVLATRGINCHTVDVNQTCECTYADTIATGTEGDCTEHCKAVGLQPPRPDCSLLRSCGECVASLADTCGFCAHPMFGACLPTHTPDLGPACVSAGGAFLETATACTNATYSPCSTIGSCSACIDGGCGWCAYNPDTGVNGVCMNLAMSNVCPGFPNAAAWHDDKIECGSVTGSN